MGTLLSFPARPFPKEAPRPILAPSGPVEPSTHRELRLTIAELAVDYGHTADRIADSFRLSQTGPLRVRSSALGAAFAELASISSDPKNGPTARYAALLLVAIAFQTQTPGAA